MACRALGPLPVMHILDFFFVPVSCALPRSLAPSVHVCVHMCCREARLSK